MKVLLDIKDNKAGFVMELLKNLPFVKAKTLTPLQGTAARRAKGSRRQYEPGQAR
jgi:hypothetical protein